MLRLKDENLNRRQDIKNSKIITRGTWKKSSNTNDR